MAFDGITIANLVSELNRTLTGGRISKIAQPECDELLLTIKSQSDSYRLLLSADAGLPLIYLTPDNKKSPMTAPGFCMLLRKHIQNGRILSITQPGMERIVRFEIEHLDEMGDLRKKYLIAELMGKHSNILFVNEENIILDAIKHINASVSSVREVLPGRPYFVAGATDKQNPLEETREGFLERVGSCPLSLCQAVYKNYTGLSPVFAQELCYEAGLDGDCPVKTYNDSRLNALYDCFLEKMQRILAQDFSPSICYDKNRPVEYGAFPYKMYEENGMRSEPVSSMSRLLETYYAEKNAIARIRQRSTDLRKITATALERTSKKYDLQMKQMEDTKKRETYRIYGELLNTYGYQCQPGAKSLEAQNYYSGEMITIPLDETMSATENAKKYFEKYGKLKRTYEALSALTVEVKEQIAHLESIMSALDIALHEEDLVQIKEELIESGYIRRKGGAKKVKVTSKPFHYVSSDGFHMYVGKNNYQNDELTFKQAVGNDWWFHAKNMPGSHVIVKTDGAQELPDRTFEEAGRLAAYYSEGRDQDKVEVDYIQKKHVKKPAGAKPGFVVYYTNYSLVISPDISGLTELS